MDDRERQGQTVSAFELTGGRERAAFGKVALIITILAVPAHAAGDEADTVPPEKAETIWFVRDRARIERWRFFEPPPVGGDHEYAYGANRLQAGVLRRARRYELSAALQYVHFGGLPRGR